jgi:asparagine synthase (glutamine-hydrolysing)
MCGIAGYIDFHNKTDKGIISAMVKTLHHRGPDDCGMENISFRQATIGLGHARLSIIDLTSGGHQPMHYKHLSIVYNGEIYNFTEIREQLAGLGHHFSTSSDTEVILHAYAQWGANAVDYFIGMFALVIFDRERQEIVLIRDRAGVKPLYYYRDNGLFLFASELKAFYVHPSFKKQIDLSALALYFDFGYIPAPYTIFNNCHKLESGQILRLELKRQKVSINTYWNIEPLYKKSRKPFLYEEAKDSLRELLISACNYRLVSDVPVGVFLSGGYDSTAVTAIMQKDRTEKLRTFTLGFEDGNSEVLFARETARYLGTEHEEYICTSKEAKDIIPDLPLFYDEPFADSSAIPTTLVSRFARKKVKVALSADGGDELFAGYVNYFSLSDNLAKLNLVPDALKSISRPLLKTIAKILSTSNPDLKHKVDGIARSLNRNKFQQAADLYRIMNSLPNSYSDNLFITPTTEYPTKYNIDHEGFHHEVDIALAADYQMYLQGDILTKVDRATMSVSLEGREPLLDHRLFEYVASLPFEYKNNGRIAKLILKDIVHDYIPEKMMNRPKSGFALPIFNWLCDDLQYLIDEYLNEKALSESGLFYVPFVLNQVSLFKQGKLHYKTLIWKLLMFQMWFKKWMI